ncbi:E3 ubiquitin-protein ligase DTX1 [Suricata suricatta]|uniref:E3 ubiquitin-protein ligase DTX1 n=1 Tax=Suricata suricatta TaxID=37032 RepID=UPI001155B534|nr:E3 ubiquitin-protein ligase DTX1 [Suricata suricatta]
MSRPGQGVMVPVNGLGFPPQNVARVVVWEWLNEHSRWRPYTATVCHHIENVLKEDARGSVVLGQVDAQLVPYIIDLQSMHQFRQDTDVWQSLVLLQMGQLRPGGTGLQTIHKCCPQDSQRNGSASTPKPAWQWVAGVSPKPPSLSPGHCPYVNVLSEDMLRLLGTRAARVAPEASSISSLVTGPLGTPSQPIWEAPVAGADSRGKKDDNNLNRPGPQRATGVSARASIPPGVPALPVKNLNGTGPVHPALAGMTGILLCAAGLPVCLTRAPKPILHPPPVSKSEVKPVPGVPGVCRKTKKKHLKKSKNPEDVVRRYMQKVKNPPDEDCTICMERLVTASGYEGVLRHKGVRPELVGRLGRCGHMYHLLCLVAMYSNGNKDGSLQCPTCKAIYGEKTGTQPPGKMEFHLIPHSLPGFADTQTIRIVYDIPTGIQGPEHPNPGKKFTARGFPRHCYLPNNEKGRKVLRLLITAWDRRLIFTIGTSNTTGESDTVVWNEIHHKTEFGSNLTGHGYPDASYLDNVLAELTAQGVSEAAAKA